MYNRALYKSGTWGGSVTAWGKKRELLVRLQFDTRAYNFSGTGLDAIEGTLRIDGTFVPSAPYSVSAKISYPGKSSTESISVSGFRESASSGMFGQVEGAGGSFLLRPVSLENREDRSLAQRVKNATIGKHLKAMGFEDDVVQVATSECETLEEATLWASAQQSGGGSASVSPAPSVPVAPGGSAGCQQSNPGEVGAGSAVSTSEAVTRLLELGFPESQAREALEACAGNVDQACEMLLDSS